MTENAGKNGVMAAHRKILCLIETLGVGGGAEKLIADIVPLLKARGFSIEVAALFDYRPSFSQELRDAGVTVHELHWPENEGFLARLSRLHRFLRAHPGAVLWAHLFIPCTLLGALRLFRLGLPTIATFHCVSYVARPATLRASVRHRALGILSRAVDLRVGVTEAVSAQLRADGLGEFRTALNGVNLRRLRAYPDSDLSLPEDFIFIPTRFVEKKGHVILVAALRKLKNRGVALPTLVGCGEGAELQAAISEECRKSGIAFQALGVLAHPQIISVMRRARLIVIPSLQEGFGLSLVEALALDRVVLASSIPPFVEVAGDARDGMLWCAPGCEDSLADALAAALAGETPGAEARARLRARIESEFTIEACAGRWAEIFRNFAPRD